VIPVWCGGGARAVRSALGVYRSALAAGPPAPWDSLRARPARAPPHGRRGRGFRRV